MKSSTVVSFFVLLVVMKYYSNAEPLSNVLRQGEEKRDESMLTSANGMFTLGAYSPDTDYFNTSYIGLWYANESSSPVWIANRNSPFSNHYGSISLTLDPNCSLRIMSKIIYNNYSFSLFDHNVVVGISKPSNSCYAILQDDGNFILQEGVEDAPVAVLWQSFDHPTDTLLHGMKIGINHKTGSTWSLTSWISWASARLGTFTLVMNPNNTKQLLILLGQDVFWNSGNWQDGRFEFLQQQLPGLNGNGKGEFEFNLVSNERETYFQYSSPKLYGLSSSPKMENRGLRLYVDGYLWWREKEAKIECGFFENESSLWSDISSDGCVWEKKHKMPRNSYGNSLAWAEMHAYGLNNVSSYFKTENLTEYECRKMCISDCDCIAYNLTNQDKSGCQLWGREQQHLVNQRTHMPP